MVRSDNDNDDSTSDADRRRKDRKRERDRRKVKHKKEKHRHRSKKRHRRDDSTESSDSESCISSSSSSNRYRQKKKKKSGRKKEKKRHRKDLRQSEHSLSPDDDDRHDSLAPNYQLAETLASVLDRHPPLATDLPILLRRLCDGTTLDLSNMADCGAAQGLASIFGSLEPFGVQRTINQAGAVVWSWARPLPIGSSSSRHNDLVLLRVVRTLLDQIGVTMEAVLMYEEKQLHDKRVQSPRVEKVPISKASSPISDQVLALLRSFPDLGSELKGLCELILGGESVALEGLPNKDLQLQLEKLLLECGLERAEMEMDDSEDEQEAPADASRQPTMGFGLPEGEAEVSRLKLQQVIDACSGSGPADDSRDNARQVKGPMRMPQNYSAASAALEHNDSDEDDIGPLPLGAADARVRMSEEQVKLAAHRRNRELLAVKEGINPADVAATEDGGGREEWMLVAGSKYDFLSSVKSGQPLRNRTFKNVKGDDKDQPMDPKVRAELDALVAEHHAMRGPSLLEQHRDEKRREKEAAAAQPKEGWKWNRDADLDKGRRVDRDALNQVFGGAAADLKTKFHTSFR
jgi:Protein of unknown function (DUF3752)